jgi:hypothetical protein
MSAIISVCGQYRYLLTRTLDDENHRSILSVMLIARLRMRVRTILRSAGSRPSRSVGVLDRSQSAIYMRSDRQNLRNLWAADDPVGPENDSHIEIAAMSHEICVAAWGGNAGLERATAVYSVLARFYDHVMCLGVVASGEPKNPLYIRNDTDLQPWIPRSSPARTSKR